MERGWGQFRNFFLFLNDPNLIVNLKMMKNGGVEKRDSPTPSTFLDAICLIIEIAS